MNEWILLYMYHLLLYFQHLADLWSAGERIQKVIDTIDDRT